MLDIIRGQIRIFLHARTLHLCNLSLAAVFFLMMFLDSGGTGERVKPVTDYIAGSLPVFAGFASISAGLTVGMVSGADFTDKTINHELTSGRSRAVSFFGRAIPALIGAPLIALAVTAMPFLLYGMLFGFGDVVPVSEVIRRLLLMLFPNIRMTAFCLMTVFILKNPTASISFSTLVMPAFALAQVAEGSVPVIGKLSAHPFLLAPSGLSRLGKFDSWYTYDLSLNQYFTYDPALPASTVWPIIVCAVIMTAVYLLIGYHFFHVDDMA